MYWKFALTKMLMWVNSRYNSLFVGLSFYHILFAFHADIFNLSKLYS